MFKDVDSVNNLRSTGIPCTWPSYLPTEGVMSTRPFAHYLMDLITDLPLADGFDLILVVVDQGLLKEVILILCNKTLTAEDTGKLL